MAPLDYLAGGMQQTGQGLAGLQHPQSPRQMAGAASDLIRGGMTIATPFMLPELFAAPKAAIGGMLTYGAAQQAIEQTATHLGLPQEYAKLAGDIGGVFGGHRMYQWLADMARIPEQNIANGIYQKIQAHMAALEDPTLTPQQRDASKAAVDALLTSLRGEEGWKLPALFPNPNPLEKDAYKYYRSIGGPPNAGMASGSPIVRGSTWLSGMTPAGGYMDVRAKAQTVEALKTRAAGLLTEAAPAEGPAREFYSQVEDAVNKSTPVNVPLRVDKDGSQISGDVKAPVDLRDLKYDLDPLWQKLQFLPMADQSVSHAYSALKVLTNANDHIDPLTAEVALSNFKKASLGEPGGIEGALIKTVIPKLQAAVDSSVKEYAGDDALRNLQSGRRAAAKEFGAEWLGDQFKLAQQEGGFAHGRRLWNNWTNLTPSAKTTMFNPGQVAELNKFFHGMRMIEDNPNPSGTALAGAIMAQAGYAMHGGVLDPWFYLGQLGAGGIAKLLRSDLGVKLLTEGLRIPRTSARGRFVEQQLKDILSKGPSGGGGAPPEEPPPPPPRGGRTPPAAPSGGGAAAQPATIERNETPERTTGESRTVQGPAAAVDRTAQEEAGAGKDATATQVLIPGGESYNGRYRVRELSDVQPSHNGVTFQPNPKYELQNTRDYNNPDNRSKVVNGSLPGTFNPRYHITDNPDATNGPVVVDRSGNAIGGNGRAMILQRVYGNNPEGAQAYRDLLTSKARQFGIDPAEVAGKKAPVLVREVDTGALDKQTVQAMVTDLNKVGTAALTPSERAIADSRRVSSKTLDFLGDKLEAGGPDATIASTLEGKTGAQVLDYLIQDGVIGPQERAGLAKGDTLTADGKARISRLVLGRFFADPAQMDTVPAAVKNKIERIAAPLAKVERDPEWSLTPDIQGAVTLLEDMRTRGAKNIDDMLNQAGLFGESPQYSPRAVQLARALQKMSPNELTKAVRQYASDAEFAAQGPDMFGNEVTPQTSLEDALTPSGGASEGAKSALNPPPTLEDRLQKLGDDALDRVRKSGIIEGRITPSLFPAEVTKDMAVWGAARIANGAVKFGKWSKAMLDDAADISPAAVEKVRAMLPQLWTDSKKQYEHHANTFGAENIANLPQIMEYYEAGKEGKNWYNFVRPALQPIFGKNTDLFLKMFAATSPNTKVTQNVVNAVKAYRQFLLGEQFTGMQAHVDNLNRAVAGVKMSGPKVGAFGPNLMGDLNPVTVDLWMARALLGRDTVTPLQSKLVDYMTSQAAKQANLKPAEMQAAIWTGIKKLRNSRDTSAPPEQIVNEYLDKNPDVRKLFEDSLQMSKRHFRDLQSKQAPAKPPR